MVYLLEKLSERTDLRDLPIGQGMASHDWQVLVATGEAPKNTDTGEKLVVSIQDLSAIVWNFKEGYDEMSDVMNALGFAAKEFEEVVTAWSRMQDHAPVDMNSRAAQEIGHR